LVGEQGTSSWAREGAGSFLGAAGTWTGGILKLTLS